MCPPRKTIKDNPPLKQNGTDVAYGSAGRAKDVVQGVISAFHGGGGGAGP